MTALSVAQWHQRFEQQAGWTVNARQHLLDKAGIRPDTRILEIGCGTGAVLSEIARDHPQAHGIDFNLEYLSWFKKQHPGSVLAGADAFHLPYPADSFDLVCCHFFLLWISDPAAVLQEALRVLRPGGSFIAFAEPDYGGRIDHPPALIVLGEAQAASLADQGADPLMGRKLAGLAAAFPQLINIEIGIMGYEKRIHENSSFWDREWEMLISDLGDSLSPAMLGELRSIDQQARQDGSRVLFVPTFYLYSELRKE